MLGKSLKELIIIAKNLGLKLSYKDSDGKRKKYKKLELRQIIIEKYVELDCKELEKELNLI